jgi:hypothetical protein
VCVLLCIKFVKYKIFLTVGSSGNRLTPTNAYNAKQLKMSRKIQQPITEAGAEQNASPKKDPLDRHGLGSVAVSPSARLCSCSWAHVPLFCPLITVSGIVTTVSPASWQAAALLLDRLFKTPLFLTQAVVP